MSVGSLYLVAPVIAVAHVITRTLAVANVMLQIELLVPFFQLLLLRLQMPMLLVVVVVVVVLFVLLLLLLAVV